VNKAEGQEGVDINIKRNQERQNDCPSEPVPNKKPPKNETIRKNISLRKEATRPTKKPTSKRSSKSTEGTKKHRRGPVEQKQNQRATNGKKNRLEQGEK